ncbi:hypothetical protein [Paraburkholderia sp. Ac-20347]|jgi:hypothetical protein|uniref:hypothetical protein n=1 Tax=Paraburkholderia sp. Ac-20347 TaxID=2703892 RepID=UPI00197FA480|nr:hypothetical protein [Paraburkholderia sp. Ac-20347]MBN3814057.1 hypothetical protein [Paraburkholderia sp. Ac-20347]
MKTPLYVRQPGGNSVENCKGRPSDESELRNSAPHSYGDSTKPDRNPPEGDAGRIVGLL